MDRPGVRFILALLLIGVGVVFLLDSLQVLEIGALLWAAILGMAGILSLFLFVLNHEWWWALIPGFVGLSLGLLIGVSELLPDLEGDWIGALFMGGLGLGFLAIFFVRRDFWWALIPGGVLWTLALVIGLSSALTMPDELAGGVLFLGLGLTFALLSLLPAGQARMKWALIPGGVLLFLGLAVFASVGGTLFDYLMPAALVLAGVYLLVRFALSRRAN